MEDIVKALLSGAQQYGAGYIMAALCFLLYWLERKAHAKEREAHLQTSNKLFEVNAASIKYDMETAATLKLLTRVIDNIDRRLLK